MSELISGDAGRISFLIRGDYDESASYDFLDLVYYNGSTYVARKETTGNAPAENNEFWQLLAGIKALTTENIANALGYKPARSSIYNDSFVSLGRKYNAIVGDKSLAFGTSLGAYGNSSASFGNNNVSVDDYVFSEGAGNIALGYASHAENSQNIAGAKYVLKISSYDQANKSFLFDQSEEGFSTAFSNIEIGSKLFVINRYYISTADVFTVSSIDEGNKSVSVEENPTYSQFTAQTAVLIKKNGNGTENFVSCHVEGRYNIAAGRYSHAEGLDNKVYAEAAHVGGSSNIVSNYSSSAIGKYNALMENGASWNNSAGHVFAIGNGNSIAERSNAFSVMYDGTVKAKGTIMASTAADYAEFFEWADRNLSNDDRVGHFVALDGDKIRIAGENDEYILGIISGAPCILGNGDCDTWNGMYLRDEFGRIIMEPAPKMIEKENGEWETVFDNDGNVVYEGERPALNPEYDPRQRYISRIDRPEWSPVGMIGVLAVYDDGSCQVNGYCKCGNDGIATESDQGYRVISRLQDNIIKVVFR